MGAFRLFSETVVKYLTHAQDTGSLLSCLILDTPKATIMSIILERPHPVSRHRPRHQYPHNSSVTLTPEARLLVELATHSSKFHINWDRLALDDGFTTEQRPQLFVSLQNHVDRVQSLCTLYTKDSVNTSVIKAIYYNQMNKIADEFCSPREPDLSGSVEISPSLQSQLLTKLRDVL